MFRSTLKILHKIAQILFIGLVVWFFGVWLFHYVASGELWRFVSGELLRVAYGVLGLALIVLAVVFVVLPTIPALAAYKIYKKTVPPPKDDVERAARLYLGYPEFGGPFVLFCFLQYAIVFVLLATLGYLFPPDFYEPPHSKDIIPPSASTSSLETPADRD